MYKEVISINSIKPTNKDILKEAAITENPLPEFSMMVSMIYPNTVKICFYTYGRKAPVIIYE